MASRRSHAAYHCRKLVQSYVLQMRQSPFGELIWGGIIFTHSCAASQLAVGFMIQVPLRGTSSSYSICLRSSGAWLRRDAIASYVCYGSLWLSSNKSQFAFVVLSPLRYENMFFMSSCQKHLFFMSSCQKYTSSCLHANIVQRVKTCYKIKIDFRVPVCCFFGVLQCKQHPRITIAPLLQSNSATIRQ